MYHGWNDPAISALNSVDYYESVVVAARRFRAGAAEDFFRLFMVPGMQHCGGGPGTDTFDALGALERWVEEGVAPDRIIAAGAVDRTRPLCPYPQVARYLGQGSTDDARNFACRRRRGR
jgi:feruloyl esterase